MKKLLLVLLLPLTALSQMSGPTPTEVSGGEGAAGLVFLGTTENANESLSNVQVNDTIILGIKVTNWLASTNDITYAHIDVQYNKDAYTWIDETYHASTTNSNWSGAAGQNTTYLNPGYRWSVASTYEAHDLYGQWQNGGLLTDLDFDLKHLQTQITYGDLGDLDAYVTFRLKVHDAGANHDYNDNVYIASGKLVDNPNNKTYYPVYAYENQDLSLEPNADIDVAGVSVKLEVGSNIDITKFEVVPLIYNDTGYYWETIIQNTSTPGGFALAVPSNGTVDITQYLTDPSAQYAVAWEYDYDWDGSGTSTFKTLYEDILTISDVQLALKELAQHGEGAINAGVSLQNADVAGGTSGGDGELTSQDTYALLAHVTGIEELYIDRDGDGDIDDDDANNQAGRFFKTLDGTSYNTTAAAWEQNGIPHQGVLVEIDVDFTNKTSAQLFAVKGTWKGDVNLSHSPDVSANIANSAKSIRSYGSTKKVVDTNMSSFNVVEDGDRVIATILLPNATDLSAAQYRLTYDDTRLEFASVETDSGNESTNFAKHTENRINVGSINMIGGKLDDTKYQVIFTKKQTLNGVAGLITITNTDGANDKAERVEIKIE